MSLQEMGTTCRGSLQRGPQAGPLHPHKEGSGSYSGPSQRMGNTEEIWLQWDLMVAGAGGGDTLENTHSPEFPSIPTSFSPSDQAPDQPFLQRRVWEWGVLLLFFGFHGGFFTSTYTITQSVTCHTCLNGIILCALFSFGTWPSFFSFPFCKSLLSPRVDS